MDVRIDDSRQREEAARVDLLVGRGRTGFDERHDATVVDEDVPGVRTVGDHDRAADREIHSGYASSMLKSCAPSQSVSRPTSASLSLPSITVAKWLPASCPTLLENSVEPYGKRISVSEMPPGW